MSQKNVKRLRRMEEVQESLHDRMKEAVCGLYDQDVRLSNAEHSLEIQEARLTAAEGTLKEQSVRLKSLENVQDIEARLTACEAAINWCQGYDLECELEEARDALKRSRRWAGHLRKEVRRWKAIAATAAVVAVAVVLTANARGESVQPEPVQEPPAVVRTVQAVQAAPAAPEENENERIEAALLARAHRIENCIVTHYDPCVKCCGKADGITASGLQVTPYVSVAVDPDVIPMGADVLVDYGDGILHYYRADDVGGTVKGNHIDLCVNSHAEALTLGVRTATVYWVEG